MKRLVLIPVIVLILVAAGIGLFQAQLNATVRPTITAKSGTNYSTEPLKIPVGVQVIQEKEETSWAGRYGVVSGTHYLIEGTVLGIVNSTAVGNSHHFVTTYYMFMADDVLLGNVPVGTNVIVAKAGGIAQIAGGQYVNETYPEYPPLKIGAQYVLAMGPFGDLLGPAAVFQITAGLIYSHSDWNLSGVTTSDFLQTWNSVTQITTSVQDTFTSSTTYGK